MTFEEHKLIFEEQAKMVRKGAAQPAVPISRFVTIYIPPDGSPFETQRAHVKGWLEAGATTEPWPAKAEPVSRPAPAKPPPAQKEEPPLEVAAPEPAPVASVERAAPEPVPDLSKLKLSELRKLWKERNPDQRPPPAAKSRWYRNALALKE